MQDTTIFELWEYTSNSKIIQILWGQYNVINISIIK